MRIRLAILFVLLYFGCCAQKLKLGVRGGASFANLYAHNAAGDQTSGPVFQSGGIFPGNGQTPTNPYYYETSFFSDLRTGFYSELFANWELGKRWNLEVGLGYCQKGIDLKYMQHTVTYNDGHL